MFDVCGGVLQSSETGSAGSAGASSLASVGGVLISEGVRSVSGVSSRCLLFRVNVPVSVST